MTNPCKGCTDRHATCHADCPLYAAWSAEQREKHYNLDHEAKNFLIESIRKANKRNHRK